VTHRGADIEAETTLTFTDAIDGVTATVQVAGQGPRQVRIAAGQRVRISGQGGPGRRGGAAGDLVVHVHVTPHPVFARSGHDLVVRSWPLTAAQAASGARVTVPSLRGGPVNLRIPPGTLDGRTFRVRGQGVPRPRGRAGDLLVTVAVA
jgi:molecular chaperone DnaJ